MSTIYRIRLDTSTVSAQLRGISGTVTDGVILDGSYSSEYNAHEFSVSISGQYELWTDPLGGTSYSKVSSWGGVSGKYIPSDDLERPTLYIAYASDYATLNDAIDNLSSSIRSLYIPPGDYNLNSIISAPFDGLVIDGAGDSSRIIVPDGMEHAIELSSVNGCLIRNVNIVGPNTNSRSGIILSGSSMYNVVGLGVNISGFGFAVEEDANGSADYNIVMGNILKGNGYSPPILLRDSSHSKMIGNVWNE